VPTGKIASQVELQRKQYAGALPALDSGTINCTAKPDPKQNMVKKDDQEKLPAFSQKGADFTVCNESLGLANRVAYWQK